MTTMTDQRNHQATQARHHDFRTATATALACAGVALAISVLTGQGDDTQTQACHAAQTQVQALKATTNHEPNRRAMLTATQGFVNAARSGQAHPASWDVAVKDWTKAYGDSQIADAKQAEAITNLAAAITGCAK